jgi:hypothetical protein
MKTTSLLRSISTWNYAPPTRDARKCCKQAIALIDAMMR